MNSLNRSYLFYAKYELQEGERLVGMKFDSVRVDMGYNIFYYAMYDV